MSLPNPALYLADFARLARIDWPANRTLTVVCHGHSVPAGYFQTPEVRTLDSYPHLLHAALAERYPHAVINVIVTAIGGEESHRGAERFARDVLPIRPDVVTVDYGLNDRRIGLPAAASAWRSMIEAALRENVKVILLTPTGDTSADLSDPADPLNQHAKQIRALAAQHGVGLSDSLADLQAAVAAGEDLESFMSQVNHPNRRGHALVAARLAEWFPAA